MLIELLIDPSCKRIIFNRFGDNRNGFLAHIPQDIVSELDQANLQITLQTGLKCIDLVLRQTVLMIYNRH